MRGMPCPNCCANGQHALELWRSGDLALVLTDLHMPRMDGYDLAAAIRVEEQAQGARRTSIVALTANALRDEELRCRAAGMDAYLGKPVRLARLQAAIEEWLQKASDSAGNAAGRPGSPGDAAVGGPASPLVELNVLKALIGGDEAVVADVLRAFCKSAGQSGAALAGALADGDLRGVADAAHKLKSGALSIGAAQLGRRCDELQVAAQAGRQDAVADLMRLIADVQTRRSDHCSANAHQCATVETSEWRVVPGCLKRGTIGRRGAMLSVRDLPRSPCAAR